MKRLLLAVLLCFGMAADAQITHSAIPCKMGDCGFSVAYTGITGITASRLLGRGSSGAGAAQEITLGTGLTMSGTTLTPDISGSGASGRLALWSSASGLTSDAGLTYSGTGLTASIGVGEGTKSAVALSFGGYVNSGFYLDHTLGNVGISDSGTLMALWRAPVIRHYSGLVLGWASGTPDATVEDTSLSRIAPGVLGVGTGAAGSTAGTAALVGIQGARTKTVTDATPTAYASFTIADGAMYSGEILYSCKSVKGTALQIASGRIRFAATREGSTYTTQVNAVGTELVAAAAGTLACTMTIAGAAGAVTLSASCDTDQASPDSMTLRYQFDALDPAIAITGL